uniref:Ubiquitin-like domain-containing protein n=1 Tax=viral metagenome TaxID=1070528 RepID=A0A6C0IS84_9ZZZZ
MEQQRQIFRAKKPAQKISPVKGPPQSLIQLINDGNQLDALSAIRNNNFIENERDGDNNSPLILACDKKMDDIALSLIASGKSEPDHINYEGETALIISSSHEMKEVIKKLLETGNALVGHTTSQNETSLIIVCSFPDTEDIAMEMIHTGKSVPEQVDIDNATALIMACQNDLDDVALELIKTGKSNWFVRDNSGFTALDYATQNNMDEVVNAIQQIGYKELTINLNDTGFNPIEHEEEVVKDFLLDDPMNLCLKYSNKYYLTNRSYINKELTNKINIKYRCIFAGENVYDDSNNLVSYDYTADKNIYYKEKYFSMNTLIGLPILVKVSELKNIINNSFASNVYYLTPSGSLPAIVSLDYIDGGSGVGADHCQTGKKTEKCSIVTALVDCGSNLVKPVLTRQINLGQQEQEGTNPIDLNVKIQYKTKTIVIPIEQTTTIGQLKELLLEKLVLNSDIDSATNKNVRIIYTGKIYGADKNDMVVSSLPNFISGVTMSSSIQPIPVTGGKKKKTKKRITKKMRKLRYSKKAYK